MADAEQGKSRVKTIPTLFAGDYVIIVTYFVLIIGAGLYAAARSKRNSISFWLQGEMYFKGLISTLCYSEGTCIGYQLEPLCLPAILGLSTS